MFKKMKYIVSKSIFKKTVIGATFLLSIFSHNIYASDFTKTYSHFSSNESITNLLSDFAKSQNYSYGISDKLTGNISGKFDNIEPSLFLQGLKSAYGLNYYILDKYIYFYNENETTKAIFKPTTQSVNTLVQKLQNAKVVSKNLPLKVKSNLFIEITGPSIYVDEILNVAKSLDSNLDDKIVIKIFKLKHAKADDIQVNSMDRTINIPGVASILQKMVTGTSNSLSKSIKNNSNKLEGLRGSSNNAKQNEEKNIESIDINTIEHNINIIADPRINAVIIQDYAYRMPYYDLVIKELDVAVRLVEIHAAIVDVDSNETKNLGVDWGGSHRTGNFTIGGSSGNTSNIMPLVSESGGGIFSTIFNTSHTSFLMKVNLLERDKKAQTLGKPSVLTLDNVEATLEDTTTNYIPIKGYQDSDLFKIESGTVLRVTPHIIDSDDGQVRFIQMVISLQSNQDAKNQTLLYKDGEIIAPTIKQTRINTQALVREGQSLLIGGYYVESDDNASSGIPSLKDISGIGGLFGSSQKGKNKRERLLLISPKILSLDEFNVPNNIDYQKFERSPTQNDYKIREVKKEESSGCSSTRQS